jgi:glycine/D-amino acid oxidase-like deaminating enzyme
MSSGVNMRYTDSTAVQTASADDFPFVGPIPGRKNQFINAGFAGHGTFMTLIHDDN